MTPQTFRNIRKEAGLTQTELADILGYSGKQAISLLERGKNKVLGSPALIMVMIQAGCLDLVKEAAGVRDTMRLLHF